MGVLFSFLVLNGAFIIIIMFDLPCHLSSSSCTTQFTLLQHNCLFWLLDDWMIRWMFGWMVGWIDGWLVGWLDGWMVGWMDGWMVGWLDGWMVVAL